MKKCEACNGTGDVVEKCCADYGIAQLNHCACKGMPIYSGECPKCNGTGWIKTDDEEEAEEEARAKLLFDGIGVPKCKQCGEQMSEEESKENGGICDACENKMNHHGMSGKVSTPREDREYVYEEGDDPHDGLEE